MTCLYMVALGGYAHMMEGGTGAFRLEICADLVLSVVGKEISGLCIKATESESSASEIVGFLSGWQI